MPTAVAHPAAGRPRVTSRADVEHVAFELFERHGFEGTTVEEIAAAAGIGRRTFFRYFASKNDVPWGNFEDELARMRTRLAATPRRTRLMDAIRVAVVEFNRIAPDQVRRHRRRMTLILRVPALQAHATLRYADWRQVVAEFAGEWIGQPPTALIPRTIGYAALGAALAGYEQWLDDADADLTDLLDAAMCGLSAAFTGTLPPAPRHRPGCSPQVPAGQHVQERHQRDEAEGAPHQFLEAGEVAPRRQVDPHQDHRDGMEKAEQELQQGLHIVPPTLNSARQSGRGPQQAESAR